MEITTSTRYPSQVYNTLITKELNNLVQQLNSQAEINRKIKIGYIENDRKAHRSCIEIHKNTLEARQPFKDRKSVV